ncbi:MAG: hypothetical protein M3332_09490 [Actinomycetota bacterium]|nr:hypothetical protein [Actinomycetota bacterium]
MHAVTITDRGRHSRFATIGIQHQTAIRELSLEKLIESLADQTERKDRLDLVATSNTEAMNLPSLLPLCRPTGNTARRARTPR